MHSRKKIDKKVDKNIKNAWIIASAAISLSMITMSSAYLVALSADAKALRSSDATGKARYMSVADVVGREALISPSGVRSQERVAVPEVKGAMEVKDTQGNTPASTGSGNTQVAETKVSGEKGSVKAIEQGSVGQQYLVGWGSFALALVVLIGGCAFGIWSNRRSRVDYVDVDGFEESDDYEEDDEGYIVEEESSQDDVESRQK